MTISVAALSHAIHDMTHSKATHPHAPAGRAAPFGQQVRAAAGQAGQQSAASQSSNGASFDPGALLSSEMLQAMQTIG